MDERGTTMSSDFRLPGPTPLPPQVMAAMQREMIPHRGPVFFDLYRSILKRAKAVHLTDSEVLLWPASGSAGWEIGIVNLLSPGDPVLSVITGAFGARFAQVGEQLGLDVRRVEVPWGQAATPDLVRDALIRHPDVKAVFLTHNETSTGVTNPLPELAAVVRDHGALVLVDAVSSAAGLPLRVDDWGLDFVLSGSQKAWMCPPGLVITAIGPRAWDAIGSSTYPRFFWDLEAARTAAAKDMTPTTPPLTLLYAFDAALDMILDEGLDQVWTRHRELGEMTRAGIKRLGLRLLADEAYASNTVTAFYPPEGTSAPEVIDRLNDDHGITVTGGQGKLASEIIRVGQMGWVNHADMQRFLDALAATVEAITGQPQPQHAVAAR
jgi:aspartate aminotransferase-like enzyme